MYIVHTCTCTSCRLTSPSLPLPSSLPSISLPPLCPFLPASVPNPVASVVEHVTALKRAALALSVREETLSNTSSESLNLLFKNLFHKLVYSSRAAAGDSGTFLVSPAPPPFLQVVGGCCSNERRRENPS